MPTVKVIGESVSLFSPYHKKLVSACKQAGATWSQWDGAWLFPKSMENTAIELALDFFGECNGLKKEDCIAKKERLREEKRLLLLRISEIDVYLKAGEKIPDELLDND
jgi:hypothetical protein